MSGNFVLKGPCKHISIKQLLNISHILIDADINKNLDQKYSGMQCEIQNILSIPIIKIQTASWLPENQRYHLTVDFVLIVVFG